MRLRERRGWGLLFILMVKLVSGGCGVAGAELLGIGGGCCISWKCRLRGPNVWSARSGRAGLSLKRRCMMNGVVCCKCGLHEFDAFDMWKAGHMSKVGWIGVGTYLLVDLEGCPATKFPGVKYVCGGNGSKSLQSFDQ